MIRFPLQLSALALGLFLLSTGAGVSLLDAQQLQPPPGEEALLGGLGDKLLPKESSRLGDMRHGKKPVIDGSAKETEDNKAVLAKAARYYAYRLTNPIFLVAAQNPEGLTMNDLVNQSYEKLLLVPEIRGKRGIKDEQKPYLKEFSKELTNCVREVLSKNGKPIVRVNAVRILAGVAEAGQEDVADTLREIILNPKENDGIKLYAFRGFKELFDQGNGDKSVFQNADREIDCINAIANYVHRPRPATLPDDAPADEIGGYQYVRREALRALAASRYPITAKSKTSPPCMTALWLQRALNKELDPAPSLTEQAEAAIGLCQLRASLSNQYNLDVAAYEVGKFLVDFIGEYSNQRATTQKLIPWKLYTTRLVIALEVLNNQAKEPGANKEAAAYVTRLVAEAQKAMRPLEVDKDADPTGLDTFLKNNKPTNTELLKGVKEATLKTGTP
jgi:hypothetical protein